MKDIGYPLDLLTPVRHVVTEIERAAPAALSIDEMAASYRHPNTGDLARVRSEEGARDDDEAARWLIERAVGEIAVGDGRSRGLVENGRGYRFADGTTLDNLRFRRKAVRLMPPPLEFGDPFNRMSGEFSDNLGIPAKRMDPRSASLGELRESLRRFGWRKELPGVWDQNRVIIIGHRRWALCDELGIPESERPKTKVKYDDGDAGDRDRLIAAVVAQVGFKEFTAEEWKRVARYMRANGETIQAIAETLEKPYTTVQENVETLSAPDNVFDSLGRRKNQGRPRKRTDVLDEVVREMTEQGETRESVRQATGYSHGIIDVVRAELKGERRQEPKVEEQHACPECGAVHPVKGR